MNRFFKSFPFYFVIYVAAQIIAFFASAAASGVLHVRWRRNDEDEKQKQWRLYGWFTGLIFLGSCCGMAAWSCNLLSISYFLTVTDSARNQQLNISHADLQLMYARAFRWFIPYVVFYPSEFLFLSVAKLMVLDRIREFAFSKADLMMRRWAAAEKAVTLAVVVGNLVGLCGNVAAAVYFFQAADLDSQSLAAFTANNAHAGNAFADLADRKAVTANFTASIQKFCEVAVLLLIIAAFAVAGIFSARLLRSAILHLKRAANADTLSGAAGAQARMLADVAGAAGRQLLRKIACTFAVVFITFLLRAIYSIMFALAIALQSEYSDHCSFGSCEPCHNTFSLMFLWTVHTPEFQLIVVLLSSPLALLVALWGMTDVRALELMTSNRKELEALRTTG